VTAARPPALAVAALLALACASKVARAPEPGEASRPTHGAPAPSAPAAPPPVGAAGDRELDAEIGALGDAAPDRPEEAARRLAARGAAVVPRLLRELDLDRLGGVGRARILTLLARMDAPEGLPAALAALDDKRSGVRAAAIDAVSMFRDPRATAALIRLLDNSNSDVVEQAALRLGQRRDAEAVPRLGALLASPTQGTRYSAALALSRVATPEARALLRGRLNGEADPEVRAVIVAGLGDGGAAK
jgi:HEAT repeat protein